MDGKKVISFKVHNDGDLSSPRWREVMTENDVCPNCQGKMVVINDPQGDLRAFCFRCQKSYLAE